MTRMVALDEDYHVHSVFSDGVSSIDENVLAARERGLRTLCLVDHVRAGTGWVPDFVRAVWPLRALAGIHILAGVEAKILDRAGWLDLPASIDGIDLLLIADHQFPGDDGPVDPQVMRAALEGGQASAPDVIGCLVEATANAVQRVASAAPQSEPAAPRPLIAHLFSVLPKLGLDESQVPDRLLGMLAEQARRAGALVEVNEKWGCPSARSLQAFSRAGVPIVASTDSHDCADIGQYVRVRRILAEAARPSQEGVAGPVAPAEAGPVAPAEAGPAGQARHGRGAGETATGPPQ
jgi:putative hydrolase